MTGAHSGPGKSLKLCLLACLMAAPTLSCAETDLFTENSPLVLEMRIDLEALCRKVDQAECVDVPATLIHRMPDASSRALSIHVRTRGKWRLERSNCTYPPLFLIFGNDTQGTEFEGQDMLPLTTHCRSKAGRYEVYVVREYLAYQLYQLLTDKSVRTRLVHITYSQPSGGSRAGPFYSFLSEHFRSMAERNNSEIMDIDELDPDMTDPIEMATMDLFQFMIGNTDWSAVALHNILPIQDLARGRSQVVTPVPFDFDFSGLVFAQYAGPPPNLAIRSTRQRLYRGFCNPAIDWDELFARFWNIKPEVFELLEGLPGLSSSRRRGTWNFLQGFYEILDDPELRGKQIINACRQRRQ